MLVEMLVERVFLASGVVKTVFWPYKKQEIFFVFHHTQYNVCLRQVVAFAPKVIIIACLRQGFCIRKTRY
jgi:hypothetical protein